MNIATKHIVVSDTCHAQAVALAERMNGATPPPTHRVRLTEVVAVAVAGLFHASAAKAARKNRRKK
jgi:hypothetical protein